MFAHAHSYPSVFNASHPALILFYHVSLTLSFEEVPPPLIWFQMLQITNAIFITVMEKYVK